MAWKLDCELPEVVLSLTSKSQVLSFPRKRAAGLPHCPHLLTSLAPRRPSECLGGRKQHERRGNGEDLELDHFTSFPLVEGQYIVSALLSVLRDLAGVASSLTSDVTPTAGILRQNTAILVDATVAAGAIALPGLTRLATDAILGLHYRTFL
jgi:hypothetical protein